MLTAVGQGVPGVRIGDHQQVAEGFDGVVDEGPGLAGRGARKVCGGDLDQLPVGEQTQVW